MGEKPSLLKFFEDFGLMLLSIVLFLGGAFLLTLKIPFWSLFLGIASVQIGIVLIILTFDSLIKKRNKPLTDEYKTVNCLICRSSQYVPKDRDLRCLYAAGCNWLKGNNGGDICVYFNFNSNPTGFGKPGVKKKGSR